MTLFEKITLVTLAVVFVMTLITLISVFVLSKKAKKNGQVVALIKEQLEKQGVKTQKIEKEVAPSLQVEGDEEVTFSTDKKKTLDDKYGELDKVNKAYYDQIASYAGAVSGAKCFKNLRYEEYKIGSMRIVRMLIKRDVVFCEFMMQNADFKSYVAENKVAVKQAATVIKVVDADAVKVVKDTIDIAVKAIEAEKEAKRQLAKEKRKSKRKQSV